MKWIEFQFGPPMLEAMRVGAIDIGAVGDTPPIFAQAAHGDLLYIAATGRRPGDPAAARDRTIQTLADLKGKKLAFGRGSSAHNVTVAALEKAGLRYVRDRAGLSRPGRCRRRVRARRDRRLDDLGAVLRAVQNRPGVRVLASQPRIGEQFSFFLASARLRRSQHPT